MYSIEKKYLTLICAKAKKKKNSDVAEYSRVGDPLFARSVHPLLSVKGH